MGPRLGADQEKTIEPGVRSTASRKGEPSVPSYAECIRPYVESELEAASRAEAGGDLSESFRHFERAHVLAQQSTVQHVRVHWQMLQWGWRQGKAHEVLGQATRIIGAATKTVFGMVPTGNTGGANVSPVKPMPVPEDLAVIIQRCASGGTQWD